MTATRRSMATSCRRGMDLLLKGVFDLFEVLRNEGTGNFSVATSEAIPGGLNVRIYMNDPLGVADVDGDGYSDFLLAARSVLDSNVRIPVFYVNMRNGTFENQTYAWFGSRVPLATRGLFVWGDLTNDGRQDLVALGEFSWNPLSNAPEVYVQRANRTFEFVDAASNGILPIQNPQFALLDHNGDGTLDLFASPGFDYKPTNVYLGLGNGSFSEVFVPQVTSSGFLADAILVHDLNSDLLPDVVLFGTNSSISNTVIFFGSSTALLERGPTLVTTCDDSTIGAFDDAAGVTSLLQICGVSSLAPQGFYNFLIDTNGNVAQAPNPIATLSGFMHPANTELAVDDTDGDGCLDITFCGTGAVKPVCELMYGHCNGTFTQKLDFVYPDFYYVGVVTWADFDGDSKKDRLMSYTPNGALSATTMALYLSTVSLQQDVWDSHGPDMSNTRYHHVHTLDYDNDGRLDFLCLSSLFLRNVADNATFVKQTGADWPLRGGEPTSGNPAMALGDFAGHGNGMVDILYVSAWASGRIFHNLENGTFLLDFSMGQTPRSSSGIAAAGDYDGDGHLDLFVSTTFSYVAFNSGNSTFSVMPGNVTDVFFQLYPSGYLQLDVDGNGCMDIAVGAIALGSPTDVEMAFLLGYPNRTMVEAVDRVMPSSNYGTDGAGVRDFDGDGLLDVVLMGLQDSKCTAPFFGVRSQVSTTTDAPQSTTSDGSGSTSDDGDSSLGAIIGAPAGGVAVLVSLGLLAFAVLCVAVCSVLVLCVCLVCVCLVLAIVLVAGLAVVSGELDIIFDDNEDLSMDEVIARVDKTDAFRHIPYEDLRLGKRIGAGAFGAVYAGEWAGVKVAVKVMTGALTPAMIDDFNHEALMMAKVSHHPHVVQFIGACVENERLAMVLRFCDGGALDSAIENGKLDAAGKTRILGETASALAFLHGMGMVHRDVAARNVLLDGAMSAKLADLGLSRLLADGADEQTTKSTVGPVRWMSPEALVSKSYSGSSDAWSFGVLMWEVWSDGATPYGDFASIADVAVKVVREAHRLVPPPACPPAQVDLMLSLWATDPRDRPSMQQVSEALRQLVFNSSESSEDDEASLGTDYASFGASEA